MFEFSVAKKYLLPKRGQLSVSLIALMSVIVISLVVWLVLIFLSVTDGIERGWLQKLTTLNGPIRVTPTQEYFSSYYGQIDSFSAESDYTRRSIGQKRVATLSDPYSPEFDMELPLHFPKPERDKNGEFIDPVKGIFTLLGEMGLSHQEYEIGGAMMRLQMFRSSFQDPGNPGQSFLTQVAYVASFSDQNPSLNTLLLPPSPKDIEHLLLMSSYDVRAGMIDATESVEKVPPGIISGRLNQLLNDFEIRQVKSSPFWAIPHKLLPPDFRFPAQVLMRGDEIVHVVLFSDPHENRGRLISEKGALSFVSAEGKHQALHPTVPILSEEPILFGAELLPNTNLSRLSDLRFNLKGKLQSLTLEGEANWKGLNITDVHCKSLSIFTEEKANGVWLPKQFQESGVLIGDRGYLSFTAQGASAVHEQRVPITILGFYDPGIMAVGHKCILAPLDLVHSLNLANQSFQMDPSFANGIQVWVPDIAQAKAVKASLEEELTKRGIGKYWKVTTYHDYDFAKDLLQQFQSDKTLFTLIGIIILGVACCNIISLLVLLVNDKKREIGILQAMGAGTRSIALIFVLCGGGMGIISSLIGAGAALLTLHNIDMIVNFLSALQGHEMFNTIFYGKSLPNMLSTTALRFILIATPLLSLLAGLVPALKACRLRPSSILRAEA